jgi:hypothetical protein
MKIRDNKPYKTLIINTLDKISNLNKRRKDFFYEALVLFLSIKGRINFLQLSRFGNHCEQRYRIQFEKPFDFIGFNKELILGHGSGRYAIAFDPSYIDKSGKKTPGVGWYWSGCANHAKWGLEIGGIATIDIDNHTAFHLEAVQTLTETAETENLSTWYADIIESRKEKLLSISRHLVADAWFSKKPFTDRILSCGMHLVSRLRDDADLKYLCYDAPSGHRGRPRKYLGKIDPKKIDGNYFKLISSNDQATIHSAIVYSKGLKRNILLVHVVYKTSKNKQSVKLYFSTDLDMTPSDVLDFYHSRFQIEFLYRDGKQFSGLCDCQARSTNKLNFHFNMSLTSINIAKVEDWLSLPKTERDQFSMADIKTLNHNRLLLERFIDVFGINPYTAKNHNAFKELLYFGTIAA